jgi:tRNA-guanine family transglycosylase
MSVQYYLPWWPSDYIRKGWDTTKDLYTDKSWGKTYLWDYMPGLVDGILVSRMAVSAKKIGVLRQEIRFHGPIIGDSGAHTYRSLDDPPFSCENLLEFYHNGNFDYGLTLDMVASPWVRKGGLSDNELERRLRITVENAERCLEIKAKNSHSFELIGVVQGWDVESYRRCARKLLNLGFTYLAIAGQRKIALMKDSIIAIKKEARRVKRLVKLHVLGTGNPRILNFYVSEGVASFDSSTWLRKAWLSEKHNYFIVEGSKYAAYRATRIGLGDLNVGSLSWSTEVRCECPFCKDLCQEILLFRGHERNTRRGFHNIYHYVQLLRTHRGQ